MNTDYEPMLWLSPYQYGIRPRDGAWIDNRKQDTNIDNTNPKVTVVHNIHEARGADGTLLYYSLEDQSFYTVCGGRGNREVFRVYTHFI